MEDCAIIDLYWARNPEAIAQTSEKYGNYCRTVARNILPDRRDADECVNDTWLNAWNAMPEDRPSLLAQYLGKITRNLALSRWRNSRAEKRGGGGNCPWCWMSCQNAYRPLIRFRRWRLRNWRRP